MKLLKLQPYKAAVVHALQPRDSASRINFCNWFLQSVHDGDPHLTFFFDEAHTADDFGGGVCEKIISCDLWSTHSSEHT
jgi:hypothetical protein